MTQAQINNLIAQAQRRMDRQLSLDPQVPAIAQLDIRAPLPGANNVRGRLDAATDFVLQVFQVMNPGG